MCKVTPFYSFIKIKVKNTNVTLRSELQKLNNSTYKSVSLINLHTNLHTKCSTMCKNVQETAKKLGVKHTKCAKKGKTEINSTSGNYYQRGRLRGNLFPPCLRAILWPFGPQRGSIIILNIRKMIKLVGKPTGLCFVQR